LFIRRSEQSSPPWLNPKHWEKVAANRKSSYSSRVASFPNMLLLYAPRKNAGKWFVVFV
jgi:hypothetical protein